jgi:hypothetical protein
MSKRVRMKYKTKNNNQNKMMKMGLTNSKKLHLK